MYVIIPWMLVLFVRAIAQAKPHNLKDKFIGF